VPIVGVALSTIAETFIFGVSRTSQWNVWSPFIDFTFSNVRPTGTRSIKLPEEATTRGTPRQIVARPIVRLLDLTNFSVSDARFTNIRWQSSMSTGVTLLHLQQCPYS
jgi:hypothetical protein